MNRSLIGSYRCSNLRWISLFIFGSMCVCLGLSQEEHVPTVSSDSGASEEVLNEDSVRFIAPWEPHHAVVLALPMMAMQNDPDGLDVFVNLISYVTDYCDVLVCYSYRERSLLPVFIDYFRNHPSIQGHRYQVEFVESEVNSIWIRDFGPAFGLLADGSYVLYDCKYEHLSEDFDDLKSRDPRTFSDQDLEELQQQNIKAQVRKENSLTNGYLAAALQYLYNMDVSLEKTDISLQGGDFMYMGNGVLLTGESNIATNQLSKRELQKKIKDAFGFNNVHFLPNLPGSAATHLDMNMMVIDEHNVVLNEVPMRNENQRVYMDYLYDRVAKVNKYTEDFLNKHYPDVKLLRLPALPIIPDSQEKVISKLWNFVFDRVSSIVGVDWERLRSLPADNTDRKYAQSAIMKEVVSRVGPVDAWDKDDISRVLEYYFDTDFERENLMHADPLTFYRTYSNSLFVRSIEGSELFVLPRYKARNEYEEKIIPEVEKQVEQIYREARPGVAIKWLNVDPIIERLGAVHCFTSTIPYVGKSGS